MTKPTLEQLKEWFLDFTVETQRDILYTYACYVSNYPDDHNEGCYPACFWEWLAEDYQQTAIQVLE